MQGSGGEGHRRGQRACPFPTPLRMVLRLATLRLAFLRYSPALMADSWQLAKTRLWHAGTFPLMAWEQAGCSNGHIPSRQKKYILFLRTNGFLGSKLNLPYKGGSETNKTQNRNRYSKKDV